MSEETAFIADDQPNNISEEQELQVTQNEADEVEASTTELLVETPTEEVEETSTVVEDSNPSAEATGNDMNESNANNESAQEENTTSSDIVQDVVPTEVDITLDNENADHADHVDHADLADQTEADSTEDIETSLPEETLKQETPESKEISNNLAQVDTTTNSSPAADPEIDADSVQTHDSSESIEAEDTTTTSETEVKIDNNEVKDSLIHQEGDVSEQIIVSKADDSSSSINSPLPSTNSTINSTDSESATASLRKSVPTSVVIPQRSFLDVPTRSPYIGLSPSAPISEHIMAITIMYFNTPIYYRIYHNTTEPMKFLAMAHTSLDVMSERTNKKLNRSIGLVNANTKSKELFLGFLFPVERYKLYGYVTNCQAKFVVIASDSDVKDSEYKALLQNIHQLYAAQVANPFYQKGSKIESPLFDRKMIDCIGQFEHNIRRK